jgi:hypothetical protein
MSDHGSLTIASLVGSDVRFSGPTWVPTHGNQAGAEIPHRPLGGCAAEEATVSHPSTV